MLVYTFYGTAFLRLLVRFFLQFVLRLSFLESWKGSPHRCTPGVHPLKQALLLPASLRANLSSCQTSVTWHSVSSFFHVAITYVCPHGSLSTHLGFYKWDMTHVKRANHFPARARRHACTLSLCICIFTGHMFVCSYMSLGRWSMCNCCLGARIWHRSIRSHESIPQCPHDSQGPLCCAIHTTAGHCLLT